MKTSRILVFVWAFLSSDIVFAEDPNIKSVGVSTDDNQFAFELGLDAQFRYALRAIDDDEPVSQFSIRRLRPIFKFRALEQFRVTVIPELAFIPELKDGIIAWSPNPMFKVEAGQFAPPFNWERDGSSDYHQFTERTVANREFQIADGRDIGLQVDFEWYEYLDVEVGVFNGAGSNEVVSDGGHLVSGRVAWAPTGAYHEVEVVPSIVDSTVFMVAVGGYAAFENTWRDWAPPDSTLPNAVSADVFSVTTDVHLWAWRFSVHAQGFYRAVRPDDGVESFEGAGASGQAGFLIIDERLMVALRYSASAPDLTRERITHEMSGALQLFHIGNRSKLTLDVGFIANEQFTTRDLRYSRLQYQILL